MHRFVVAAKTQEKENGEPTRIQYAFFTCAVELIGGRLLRFDGYRGRRPGGERGKTTRNPAREASERARKNHEEPGGNDAIPSPPGLPVGAHRARVQCRTSRPPPAGIRTYLVPLMCPGQLLH
jgi:hypothetical protein